MQSTMKVSNLVDVNDPYYAIGLRKKHKLDTKYKIQDAARELFQKYGFQATTMEIIAASVDISPRTIFRYFDSKEDLLLSQIPDLLNSITYSLSKRPAQEDCLTALKMAILSVTSDKDKILRNAISNAIREIGVDRVMAMIITSMYRWEAETAVIFYDRLHDEVIHRLTDSVDVDKNYMDDKTLRILRSTVAHLLSDIGASIMKNIFITMHDEEVKDVFLTEDIITTSFNFFQQGCSL